MTGYFADRVPLIVYWVEPSVNPLTGVYPMVDTSALITEAQNLCATVGNAIVNGNLAQTVINALESHVNAVNTAVSALETALDDGGDLEIMEAAGSLAEAIAALTAEAGAAGIAAG